MWEPVDLPHDRDPAVVACRLRTAAAKDFRLYRSVCRDWSVLVSREQEQGLWRFSASPRHGVPEDFAVLRDLRMGVGGEALALQKFPAKSARGVYQWVFADGTEPGLEEAAERQRAFDQMVLDAVTGMTWTQEVDPLDTRFVRVDLRMWRDQALLDRLAAEKNPATALLLFARRYARVNGMVPKISPEVVAKMRETAPGVFLDLQSLQEGILFRAVIDDDPTFVKVAFRLPNGGIHNATYTEHDAVMRLERFCAAFLQGTRMGLSLRGKTAPFS